MAERTFIWDVFDYVFEAERHRIKPIRTYRNPIFLAREWAEVIQSGGFPTRRHSQRRSGYPMPGCPRCSASSGFARLR